MTAASFPPVMELSRSDAATILAFLSYGEASEKDRLRSSGTSRTSYHESRRRIYDHRWIQDRYVPEPRWVGFPHVAFGLSRPLADRADQYLRNVFAFPGAVVLWAMPTCVLGTFFLRNGTEAARFSGLWSDPNSVSDSSFVICDPSQGEVAAYFDYEGLWGHLSGRSGTAGYPRGLPRGTSSGSSPTLGPARELFQEVSGMVGSAGAVYLHRSSGLRRSQRLLVEKGLISRRVFLGPGPVPGFGGRNMNRLLFVTGSMAPGSHARDLLLALTTAAGAFPYLVAAGGGQAVIGFLGQADPPPQANAASAFGTLILPALRPLLTDIKVFQGDTATIVPWLDHRYERLFSVA
ncbi:MAG: hypothetical protein M1143_02710 [Candidatus Thermoplasmatota archaeon]|nr:hypothetical protein [Candidatus Thermoplasmatota archaeon]